MKIKTRSICKLKNIGFNLFKISNWYFLLRGWKDLAEVLQAFVEDEPECLSCLRFSEFVPLDGDPRTDKGNTGRTDPLLSREYLEKS